MTDVSTLLNAPMPADRPVAYRWLYCPTCRGQCSVQRIFARRHPDAIPSITTYRMTHPVCPQCGETLPEPEDETAEWVSVERQYARGAAR